MIALDIETSGLTADCGIWQIGAINLSNLKDYFMEEARIDPGDLVQPGALKVTGKTEEELRDDRKQSQKKLIENYLDWVEKQNEKLFLGQNVVFDIHFIQEKCIKYGFHERFLQIHKQRGMDLHTMAQEIYFSLNGKYMLDDVGKSSMSLGEMSRFCGVPDKRMRVHDLAGKVTREGKPHNALEDCKISGEIFYRLKLGRNIFEEFKDFPIPDYLIK